MTQWTQEPSWLNERMNQVVAFAARVTGGHIQHSPLHIYMQGAMLEEDQHEAFDRD